MTWVVKAGTEPSKALYVDLDGVLANYTDAFRDRSGFTPEEYKELKDAPPFWTLIKDDPEFWSSMDWIPGAESFWNSITQYSPVILSSPLRDAGSKIGKKTWVEEHLGAHVPVILKSLKADYSGPGAILVDDMEKNIGPWRSAGGIGILHIGDYADTLAQIRKAMEGNPDGGLTEGHSSDTI